MTLLRDAALRDPVEAVRRSALNVLGQLNTTQAQQLTADALADPSPQIRATAAEALIGQGRAIIPVLRPLLSARDWAKLEVAISSLPTANERAANAQAQAVEADPA